MVFIAAIVFFTILAALLMRFRKGGMDTKPLVQVIVLGDIGHSPRMQYHALSLAATGKVCVELIGFKGSKPLSEVVSHADIKIRYLRQLHIPPSWKVPFVIYAVLKVVFETVQLLFVLVTAAYRPEVLLVQTPPAVPSMLVCAFVSVVSGSKLILDFHNITHMHLAAKISNRWIIGLVRLYETWVPRLAASASLCVTNAMREYLKQTFKLPNVYTLYDRPGPQFKGRTSALARQDLEHRLKATGVLRRTISDFDFTIVSSTSWTKDEDFSLVLAALPLFSAETADKRTLLFITGKGEMRDQFVTEFNALGLKNVELVTAWLPAADYPLLLGVADIGVSVHTSTSGLDLPMKAVDMLGSELPVVALSFPALNELLADGKGGLTFTSADELAQSLLRLTMLADAKKTRDEFARFGSVFRQQSFVSEWNSVAWPVIEKFIPRRSRQSRRRVGSSER